MVIGAGARLAAWWRPAFVAAAAAWFAVLWLAPLAVHGPDAGRIRLLFAYGAYAIGHVVCHQLPERSFHLLSTALPVCARCTGIYAGAAAGALLAASRRPSARRIAARTRVVLIAAAIPTIATLVYEWTAGDMPANWLRAAAGVPLGAAVAWIIREVN